MRWILISLILLGTLRLHAANPEVWHVGDIASEDVRTPVALDFINPDTTPLSKAEAASQTPVIFIVHPNTTNTMVENLTTAFTSTHADFQSDLKETFQQSNLSETAIQSPEFENFVRGFNVKAEKLSISPGLARQWARGETGLDTFSNLVAQLLQATDRPVLPDTLPDGFVMGDTVRLVPYHSSQEELTLTLEEAEQSGTVYSRSSLTTVTQLRASFRRGFSAEDKLLAHSLASFIHSNVKLDTNLTEIARDRAVRSNISSSHYDAGQIIVQRGQVVDANILAALKRLNDVSPAARPNPPAPAVHEPAQPAPMPAEKSQPAPVLPGQTQDIRGNYIWMGAACTGVSVLILLAYWRLQLTGRREGSLRPRTTEPFSPNQMRLPPELAPQLAEMLKSVVVQELATQRRELLQAQQHAAVEVVRLMQRLNELRAPLQERLAAYEHHIQQLEKELGEQSKENRELLKLQIDMLKEQVKTERAASRINFN